MSASIFWLIVAMTPRAMSFAMSSAGLMFIFLASSETEIDSMMSISLGIAIARASAFFLSCRAFSASSSRLLNEGLRLDRGLLAAVLPEPMGGGPEPGRLARRARRDQDRHSRPAAQDRRHSRRGVLRHRHSRRGAGPP